MPVFVLDLRACIPATFANLMLPAHGVPVTHDGATLCHATIPESGVVECDVPRRTKSG